jgi:hypothetical protein
MQAMNDLGKNICESDVNAALCSACEQSLTTELRFLDRGPTVLCESCFGLCVAFENGVNYERGCKQELGLILKPLVDALQMIAGRSCECRTDRASYPCCSCIATFVLRTADVSVGIMTKEQESPEFSSPGEDENDTIRN